MLFPTNDGIPGLPESCAVKTSGFRHDALMKGLVQRRMYDAITF